MESLLREYNEVTWKVYDKTSHTAPGATPRMMDLIDGLSLMGWGLRRCYHDPDKVKITYWVAKKESQVHPYKRMHQAFLPCDYKDCTNVQRVNMCQIVRIKTVLYAIESIPKQKHIMPNSCHERWCIIFKYASCYAPLPSFFLYGKVNRNSHGTHVAKH